MAAPVALRTRNVRVAHAPVGSCVSGLVCAWLLIKHTRRAKAKTTPHTQLDHSVFLRVKKVESSSYGVRMKVPRSVGAAAHARP